MGVQSECVNAAGNGTCECDGRNVRGWFQIGPEAPGLGKAPDDRKSQSSMQVPIPELVTP